MNYDIRLMLDIYKTYDLDWFGEKITNINKLTKHHIIKREHGGENGISNYALLLPSSHKYIHYLEEHDPETFDYINELFLELNRSVAPPTKDYYFLIDRIKKRNHINVNIKKRR